MDNIVSWTFTTDSITISTSNAEIEIELFIDEPTEYNKEICINVQEYHRIKRKICEFMGIKDEPFPVEKEIKL